MGDTKRGIYRKYEVTRTDGSSGLGGKHENCCYFVLDLERDECALPALAAYAEACRATHPELARDVESIVATRTCGCRSVGDCPHVFLPQTPSEAMADAMTRGGK